MKRTNISLFSLLFLIIVSTSCNKSSTLPYTQDGNWVTVAYFGGNSRTEASSFTVGNYAYVATGFDLLSHRYNDCWQFDPAANNNVGSWTQVANMPDTNAAGGSTKRNSAVGFNIDTLGYVGTGYDGYNPMQDFWQYSPTTNSWTQLTDFPGGARFDAVGFGIGNNGYITTGYDGTNDKNDNWQFTPQQGGPGTWSSQVSLPGAKRYQAVAFVYQNKGYVVTGQDNGQATNDFWVFDPTNGGSWTQLRHITNFTTDGFDDSYTTIVRWNSAAFVILGTNSGDKAYISTGNNNSLVQYTWEYDFKTDLWVEKTPFEGAARQGAVGLTVQNRGFITLGQSSSTPLSDTREFHPNQVYNPND